MNLQYVKRLRPRVSCRQRGSWTKRAFLRPLVESLEPRGLLDASGIGGYDQVSAAWFDTDPRATQSSRTAFIGPLAAAVGSRGGGWESSAEVAQWIVRLTPEAIREARSVTGAAALLDRLGHRLRASGSLQEQLDQPRGDYFSTFPQRSTGCTDIPL